jgi:hypothetical protein
MTIHWIGYLWTFLAVLLAAFLYRMASGTIGKGGQI